MGLIKTAIMAGAGIYAVNKIAKTAEHRHSSSPNPNPQVAQGGYWGPPLAAGRETSDAYYPHSQNYGDNQQQPEGRYWVPQRDQRALPSSASYPPREEYFDDRKFEEVYYQADNGNGRNDRVNPPAYGTQREFPPVNQQGQVFERRGVVSNVGDLADMAMRLVGGEEGGKMGSKLGNGREIVGRLFK